MRDAPVDRFTVLLVQGKIQLQDGTAGLRLSSKSLYVAASFICIVKYILHIYRSMHVYSSSIYQYLY